MWLHSVQDDDYANADGDDADAETAADFNSLTKRSF